MKKLSESYAEYTLRTKLTETELKAALKAECGNCFSAWRNMFQTKIFFYCRKTEPEIILLPCFANRNSLRGVLHITCEPALCGNETILHIRIIPRMRSFILMWYGFLLGYAVPAVCFRIWIGVLGALAMGCLGAVVFAVCRSCAEAEIPGVKKALESLLTRLEAAMNNRVIN